MLYVSYFQREGKRNQHSHERKKYVYKRSTLLLIHIYLELLGSLTEYLILVRHRSDDESHQFSLFDISFRTTAAD